MSNRVEKFYTTGTEYVIIYQSDSVSFVIDGLTLRTVNCQIIDMLKTITWPNTLTGPRSIDIS